MNTDINIKESAIREKVVFNESIWEQLSSKIFWAVLLLSFPLFSILILIADAQKEGIKGIVDVLLFVVLANLIPYSIYRRLIKMQKLKKVQGESLQMNREIIKAFVKEEEWRTIIDNKTYLLAIPNSSLLTWSRQFLIIYHQNEVLFNCMTFGLHGLLSPFHFLSDQKEEDRFLEAFENKIKKYAT